jgi:hypothetical protein
LELKRDSRFHALEDQIWTLMHDEAERPGSLDMPPPHKPVGV